MKKNTKEIVLKLLLLMEEYPHNDIVTAIDELEKVSKTYFFLKKLKPHLSTSVKKENKHTFINTLDTIKDTDPQKFLFLSQAHRLIIAGNLFPTIQSIREFFKDEGKEDIPFKSKRDALRYLYDKLLSLDSAKISDIISHYKVSDSSKGDYGALADFIIKGNK